MASFDAALDQMDYQLAEIRNGKPVPRLYVQQIPADIAEVTDVDLRKKTFIKIVLPLVLSANEKIMEQRERLMTLLDARTRGQTLPPADRKWLDEIAARYREDPSDSEALVMKVDQVPVSLALAQAVEESGWGTSRFAQKGNALFGQRVWSTGKGIVPEQRAEDATYEVKAFKSIADSIRAYIHNLNSHTAYAEFREMRAQQHMSLTPSYGMQGLLETLHVYSEKGAEYVENLRTLIRTNRLSDFDDAILMPEQLADNRN
jgi:Bax protein